MVTPQPIIVVQGGQYGSEAKGAIAAYICENEGVDIAVRTGATNAGHTIIHEQLEGTKEIYTTCKMQQLPVGWVNPDTELILGAGSLIDPLILARECDMVSDLTGHDVRERLYIDFRAGVHLKHHQDRSAASGRHHKIGATGKGSSEALIDKIRGRGEGYLTFGKSQYSDGYHVGDTAYHLNANFDNGKKILLEGTQGTLLDLHLGPYPYTTHKQTLPAVWMAECGLSPSLPTDIVMVIRTFPIRVAGNSGPMPKETDWVSIAHGINMRRDQYDLGPIVQPSTLGKFESIMRNLDSTASMLVPPGMTSLAQHKWPNREQWQEGLSELNKYGLEQLKDEDPEAFVDICNLFEMTTVTKKLRRVADLSTNDLALAAMLCRPHRLAVTFMNYVFPENWSVIPPKLTSEYVNYLSKISQTCSAPVDLISWGPSSHHISKTPFSQVG